MTNLLGGVAGNAMAKYQLPGWYQITPGQIGANATGNSSLTTDGDSIFRLVQFQGYSDVDAVGDISPNNFAVRITLQNGRVLTSPSTDFIGQRIICPTQMFYVPLSWQIDFPEKSILEFSFLNLTAGNINIKFSLVGFKIYPNAM